ncbi:hypothetical protein [sulfur-oxidizing endosymbiont of Gigantopelta aegis]|uniref:hypothetical protein n=1 Tax=sulfur-oxidizing endosymbiont of Gigantopelta aegis TaxID=2794934 RepID=UPI001BE3F578|nr:hypothetical protein [sulfur-oxidizing endosymbiont of Gigantopelta aegis]
MKQNNQTKKKSEAIQMMLDMPTDKEVERLLEQLKYFKLPGIAEHYEDYSSSVGTGQKKINQLQIKDLFRLQFYKVINRENKKMPDLTGSQYADKVLLVALKKIFTIC